MSITYSNPFKSSNVQDYISDVLHHSGLDSDKYCKKSTELLEHITKAKQTLLTHSCTAALEMAAILIDIKPGDEVIMPSYTFVSTANAFVLRGAVPVFVDIREDTLNIDEALIEDAITPKTKAIVPVHYAGVGCDMDIIMDIAKRHNLYVIEDAAQCIGATYKGKHLGTIGHFGTLSFHHTKNITSGFGGALLINDNSPIDRAKIIWQKGTNREAFIDGEIDKYTWKDIGSSFMMPELSAAVLASLLEQFHQITKQRLIMWNQQYRDLKRLEDQGLFRLPVIPDGCEHNAHIFYSVFSSVKQRDIFLQKCHQMNFRASFHYIPLHLTQAGLNFGRIHGKLDNTVNMSSRLIRLPLEQGINSKMVSLLEDSFEYHN